MATLILVSDGTVIISYSLMHALVYLLPSSCSFCQCELFHSITPDRLNKFSGVIFGSPATCHFSGGDSVLRLALFLESLSARPTKLGL